VVVDRAPRVVQGIRRHRRCRAWSAQDLAYHLLPIVPIHANPTPVTASAALLLVLSQTPFSIRYLSGAVAPAHQDGHSRGRVIRQTRFLALVRGGFARPRAHFAPLGSTKQPGVTEIARSANAAPQHERMQMFVIGHGLLHSGRRRR
jgi:hypothetical protein